MKKNLLPAIACLLAVRLSAADMAAPATPVATSTPVATASPTPAVVASTPGTPTALPSTATASMPGLKVGEKAIDFTLKNADGKEVALKDMLKKGKVALLFYRSGDWCPYCINELQDLQKNIKNIEAAGVEFAAISYDTPETLTRVAAKYSLTFPLLSDIGSKTITAYGVLNKEATGRAAGVAYPVIYILDAQGVIRVKLMREGYRERPAPAEIIAGAKSFK